MSSPNCPSCGGAHGTTIDSRPWNGTIRRRRKCLKCDHRWTTGEVAIELAEQVLGPVAKEKRGVRKSEKWESLTPKLIALWDEGHSTAKIGRRLGVTKNAIVGKAHRLNLPPRPSPIKRIGYTPPRRPPPAERPVSAIVNSLASSAAAVRTRRMADGDKPAVPRYVPPPGVPMTPRIAFHMPIPAGPTEISAAAMAMKPIVVPRANAYAWGAERGCYDLDTINRKRLLHSLAPFEVEGPRRNA